MPTKDHVTAEGTRVAPAQKLLQTLVQAKHCVARISTTPTAADRPFASAR